MFYTYILKSQISGRYYIGYTANLTERLKLHNTNRSKATKNLGPWSVFYIEKFDDEASAIRRERQIKSWKSRAMIEKLKSQKKSRILDSDKAESGQ